MYIHDPAVDIAKLLKPKEAGAMSRVIEGKALAPTLVLVVARLSTARLPSWHRWVQPLIWWPDLVVD